MVDFVLTIVGLILVFVRKFGGGFCGNWVQARPSEQACSMVPRLHLRLNSLPSVPSTSHLRDDFLTSRCDWPRTPAPSHSHLRKQVGAVPYGGVDCRFHGRELGDQRGSYCAAYWMVCIIWVRNSQGLFVSGFRRVQIFGVLVFSIVDLYWFCLLLLELSVWLWTYMVVISFS